MNFEDIYSIIDKNSHETAFSPQESKAYYDLLMSLPEQSNVVEIGIEFGRSTMIAAFVSKEHTLNQTSIDNWSGGYGQQAFNHVTNWRKEYDLNFNLWSGDSGELSKQYDKPIDLLFIDGDHSYDGVLRDMSNWIDKVKPGGYVCFHDYGRDSLPDVYRAVNDFMNYYVFDDHVYRDILIPINQVYTLGIFKKVVEGEL